MIQLTVAGDAEAAARTTAERIAAVIADARDERGAAHISLAGGRTPARTYRMLARIVHDWRDVHLWYGDERCVPLDDPDSNHKLIVDNLLANASQPPPTVHPVVGAADDGATAAAAYEAELRAALGGDPPQLDVALLGLGEDGHTASLFPNDPVLEEQERLVLPVHGTKPPFERITFTLPLLRAARKVIVLAEGAGKAWAIQQLMSGPTTRIPASMLDGGRSAEIELIVDHTAAPS